VRRSLLSAGPGYAAAPFSAGCPLCRDPGGAASYNLGSRRRNGRSNRTAELSPPELSPPELSPPELSPKESFAALLDESLGVANGLEGTVVKDG